MNRRDALKLFAVAGASAAAPGCADRPQPPEEAKAAARDAILSVEPLGFPWRTRDPFLFCVHHDDAYPAGNGRHGPATSLEGRDLGRDFEGKDGWRMYHGRSQSDDPVHGDEGRFARYLDGRIEKRG